MALRTEHNIIYSLNHSLDFIKQLTNAITLQPITWTIKKNRKKNEQNDDPSQHAQSGPGRTDHGEPGIAGDGMSKVLTNGLRAGPVIWTHTTV